jgi:arginyl-tRNA synthetase
VIREDLISALERAAESLGLPPLDDLTLEVPRQREHGDWSSNLAMRCAKPLARNPRELAGEIVGVLQSAKLPHVRDVEVAGPGFVNFHLEPTWVHDVVREVVAADTGFGTSTALAGRRINLEFVSANPTGPLHAGGGRWIATGDAIANLLAAQGADVHREYYVNDTGNQLKKLEASLAARYRGTPFPDDGYVGQYVTDLAVDLKAEHGDDLSDGELCELGLRRILDGIKDDVARVGVRFDTWFSERTLHERGDVDSVLVALRANDATYVHEGAEWLRTEALGDTRDRVLVKADGTKTYLCNDLAYHRDKFARGYTHLINIWGSDHHGQVKSLQAGVELVTGRRGEPEIILGQLVKLVRGGEEVKISKRSGNIISLADILDEVDGDVARMTFLLQGLDTKQTFDLDLVTSQAMDNPVYYVQMAHARIASIARKASEHGVVRASLDEVDLGVLVHEREVEALRKLALYPDVVAVAAAERAPHKIAHWAHDFSGAFHGFYHDCRVIGVEPELTQARLWFNEACRIGLASALGVLGVRAPDEMARVNDAPSD